MSKKNFKGGLSSLLGDQPQKKVNFNRAKKFLGEMKKENTATPNKIGRPQT